MSAIHKYGPCRVWDGECTLRAAISASVNSNSTQFFQPFLHRHPQKKTALAASKNLNESKILLQSFTNHVLTSYQSSFKRNMNPSFLLPNILGKIFDYTPMRHLSTTYMNNNFTTYLEENADNMLPELCDKSCLNEFRWSLRTVVLDKYLFFFKSKVANYTWHGTLANIGYISEMCVLGQAVKIQRFHGYFSGQLH